MITIWLVSQLLEAREDRSPWRLLRQMERFELLIFDKLGYVPCSKAGTELLFDVIRSAYGRTSVVITTNLPFENWKELISSEGLTEAMLDRFTHRVHILESKGELPLQGRQCSTLTQVIVIRRVRGLILLVGFRSSLLSGSRQERSSSQL